MNVWVLQNSDGYVMGVYRGFVAAWVSDHGWNLVQRHVDGMIDVNRQAAS